MHFFFVTSVAAKQMPRSRMDCNSPVAVLLHVVLDLRGQGGEITIAAVIDNNDEPMCSPTQAEA